jgi:AcrR family transcriptional regulator
MSVMTARTRRSDRRTDALSRERIVKAAVELLDAHGENELTFRALTERLATGPGAIYWHVANKDELLAAATEGVVGAVLAVEPEVSRSPQEEIRAVALGLFEAVEAHPWLATQLAVQMARTPWGSVAPRIFERIGRQVRALGVPERSWFVATSALVHYVFGAAGQNAVNGRVPLPGPTRAEFMDRVARAWAELDADDFSFMRAVADEVRDHDDREQFLAGVDFLLRGIMTR